MSVACSTSAEPIQKNFYVSIETSEYFTVTDENPKSCSYGGTVSFYLEFSEGYLYDSNSANATYENNVLTLENVTYSQTITIDSKRDGDVRFTINNDSSKGTVTCTNDIISKYYSAGTTLTLKVEEKNNYHFTCWSLGSLDSVMPYSYSHTIELTLTEDTELYVNYYDEENEYNIVYYGNNGLTEDGKDVAYYSHDIGWHRRINTMQGANCFTRDGYILDSWNTASDGSGERIGLGSRITPSDDVITLYAIWVEETSIECFTFQETNTEAYVASYTGDYDVVAVPSYYNGKPVTKILEGSFNSSNLIELYLSTNVVKVEQNAFIDCVSLTALHTFDNLQYIDNNAFPSSPISTWYINSHDIPKYQGVYMSLWTDKVDLLILKQDKKKFINVGNSNTYFSIDSSYLVEAFPEYDAVSLGLQRLVGVRAELSVINALATSNDIIVLSIEFKADESTAHYCDPSYFFNAYESNYDVLLYLNLNDDFTGLFEAYNAFIENKNIIDVTPFSCTYDKNMTEYGETKLISNTQHEADWYASELTPGEDTTKQYVKDMLTGFDSSQILVSCCSYNVNSIRGDNIEKLKELQITRESECVFPVISDYADYGFDGTYFPFDNYHLRYYNGTIIRSQQLVSDLQTYFNSL